MKIEQLMARLESVRVGAESDGWERDLIVISIIDILLDYINNTKIRDKVEEIPL